VEKYYVAISRIATVKMTMVPNYVVALKFGERSSQLRKALVRGRCSKRLTRPLSQQPVRNSISFIT